MTFEEKMTQTDHDIYDITFVGAGPVALYGMYYAGLRLMRYKAIDMMEETGGGLMALYPEKYVYDVGGFPRVLAKELAHQLHLQGTQYPHTLALGEQVKQIVRESDEFFLITTDRGKHYSRTICLCMGIGSYTPKKLDNPSVLHFENRGVQYWVKAIEPLRGKHVLVVGGGDSAFDYSLMLQPVAASVTHIHRNDFFAAHEDSVKKVKASSVRMKFPYWEIKELHGGDRVERATIFQSKSGEEENIPVDAVILSLGFHTDPGPMAEWGLEVERNCIKVDSRMRTAVPGIFAAGDIVTYDGKLKLISTGFGEVAIAVNNAKALVDPKAKVSPGHSTEKHEVVMHKIAAQKHQAEMAEKK
jgi:thioredoxin reductase (NADPH)